MNTHKLEFWIATIAIAVAVSYRGFSQTIPVLNAESPSSHHHHHQAIDTFNYASIFTLLGDEQWDGRFGFSGIDGEVYAVKVDGYNVYLGGNFSRADTVVANNIVRLDTRTNRFSAMGSGTNVHVHAIEVANNGDVYIGGDFTQIGADTIRGLARWDGTEWHPVGKGVMEGKDHYGACVWAIKEVGKEWYIGGDFKKINGQPIEGLARWNSTTDTWSQLGDGISGTVFAIDTMGSHLYVAGRMQRAGITVAGNIAMWDGKEWKILGQGASNGVNNTVSALASDKGMLYVGGTFTMANGDSIQRIAAWNGVAWSGLGKGLSGVVGGREGVFAIEVVNNDIYAVGGFSNQGSFARWDGKQWHPISLIGSGVAFSIDRLDSMLYIGGKYGEDNCRYIGSWDIPKGLWQCRVRGATYTQAIAANNATIYFGGSDLTAWNSRTDEWERVAEFGGYINDLHIHDGYLYVAGNLGTINGSPYVSLARLNLTSRAWDIFIAGENNHNHITTIALRYPLLYVGGELDTIAEEPYAGIAELNLQSMTWRSLGDGMQDVRSIAFWEDDIVVGGKFTNSGNIQLNNIARWDGTQWHPFGHGLPAGVRSVVAAGSALYAAGSFDTVGFTIIRRVTKWENNTWTTMQGGVQNTLTNNLWITDLAAHNDQLYAAGSFTKAGFTEVQNIARWDNTKQQWFPLGTGIDGSVNTLLLTDDALYAGGSFFMAGGKSSINVARWSLKQISSVKEQSLASTTQLQALIDRHQHTATIMIELPNSDHVNVQLFDQLGGEVASLYKGSMQGGTTQLHWDYSSYPIGCYFIRLSTSNGCCTQMVFSY